MSIVFLVPNAAMAKTASRVANRLEKEQPVIRQALLSEAIPVARRLEQEGAEVFITRGGTALALKQGGIRTPIVHIPITGKDIALSLSEALSRTGVPTPHIAIVAFRNMMQHFIDFIPYLKLEVSYYPIEEEANARERIQEAMSNGVEVLIGGVITVKTGLELGVPSVLLESGASSFSRALRDARKIVYARRLESRRGAEVRAILDYSHEGIVSVNRRGVVTLFNPAAEALTGVRRADAVGRSSTEVIPSIAVEEALSRGESDIDRLVSLGRFKAMMNRVPIRMQGKIFGAVATLHDVTRIEEMEHKIRREIYSSGHVAKFRFDDIIAVSPLMRDTVATAQRYARTDFSILIRGESGVGKELFAQSIHNESVRSGGPFVAVNCAALPESLLESELFGYVEGAFTGASRKGKPGLFELAHHGTIFLDEISEIPLRLQGRLLRVLQEREVMRLGHDRVVPIDVRVITATNRDLPVLVDSGSFRSDLYWRLNVLSLPIPPLRRRSEEVLPLLRHFLTAEQPSSDDGMRFARETESFLTAYDWPGNVRELRNFCDRLQAIWSGSVLTLIDARRLLDIWTPRNGTSGPPRLSDAEIRSALEQSGGSVTKAAQILGVHRTTLWRRLKDVTRVGRGYSPLD